MPNDHLQPAAIVPPASIVLQPTTVTDKQDFVAPPPPQSVIYEAYTDALKDDTRATIAKDVHDSIDKIHAVIKDGISVTDAQAFFKEKTNDIVKTVLTDLDGADAKGVDGVISLKSLDARLDKAETVLKEMPKNIFTGIFLDVISILRGLFHKLPTINNDGDSVSVKSVTDIADQQIDRISQKFKLLDKNGDGRIELKTDFPEIMSLRDSGYIGPRQEDGSLTEEERQARAKAQADQLKTEPQQPSVANPATLPVVKPEVTGIPAPKI